MPNPIWTQPAHFCTNAVNGYALQLCDDTVRTKVWSFMFQRKDFGTNGKSFQSISQINFSPSKYFHGHSTFYQRDELYCDWDFLFHHFIQWRINPCPSEYLHNSAFLEKLAVILFRYINIMGHFYFFNFFQIRWLSLIDLHR